MKYLFPLIIFATFQSQAQQFTYYDFYWKPCKATEAIYVGVVQKTDSGWLRNDYFAGSKKLQMQALYEDAACEIGNGMAYYYHANGNLSAIGRVVHGKAEGLHMRFEPNGMMTDSGWYSNGKLTGQRLRWYPNGYLHDSTARVNDSMEVQVEWFDDGNVAAAGRLVNGKREGKWQFFHHNGQVSAQETYHRDQRLEAVYYTEAGQVQTDTSLVNREAVLKGGANAWRNYLTKNLYWPPNLEFSTGGSVTLGVSFIVDENGKLTNAEIYLPFHDAFDAIALKVIRSSPAWLPAYAHNRRVKAYFRQPVSFAQPEE